MAIVTGYTITAMDARLHITAGDDLVAPSTGNDYIRIHETITGSSGRQMHFVRFVDESEGKEFMCTFCNPVSANEVTVYYDGTYEIRAINYSSNYTDLKLYKNGVQIALGSNTVTNLICNSYAVHS